MIMLPLKKILRPVVLLLFWACVSLIIYGIITGLPISIGAWSYRAKNLKGLSCLALVLWILCLSAHPAGPREGVLRFKASLEQALQKKAAIWILFLVYSVLFTWQQITEYLAIEINFLPFSFYDYMLYYFFHGKIHFTGWLHGYYHHNIILFLFAPLWKLWQSPLLLITVYGALASACIFPLHAIARERFKEPLAPFCITLIFLNYRYLQNVMLMNFSAEIFYPLFVFTAVYFSMKRRWGLYYLFFILELLVKEDSFIYGVAVAVFTFFYREEKASSEASRRWNGALSALLAVGYYVFLRKVYSPLIGSDIMYGNAANYAGYGGSFREIILMFLGSPWKLVTEFFCSKLKAKVLSNILFRVAFLPLFSPAVILMFVSLLPLFFHNTEIGRAHV